MLKLGTIFFVAAVATSASIPNQAPSQLPLISVVKQSQPIQNQATSKNSEADNDARGTEKQPFVVETHNAPQSEREAEKDAEYREHKAVDDDILRFARLTLGVTIFQTLVFGATLLVSAFVAVRQLRAYVSATPSYLYGFVTEDTAAIRFKIKNSGSTPAYKLQSRAAVGILTFPLKGGESLPELTERFGASMTLHPETEDFEAVGRGQHKFSQIEIDAIRKDEKRICVYGEVIYRDTFFLWHRTRFCHLAHSDTQTMKILTSSSNRSDLKIAFEVAPMGNHAN